ncbi:tryptophan dimethylallyltransferase family protein [Streptomyces sp. NPDC053755]|uniref:tryptophan dimethylallyltransferase family protein n=1 Tax=Streptomyces sp. NPDC053755 TaxID=3155815 RepID=UPI003416FFD2
MLAALGPVADRPLDLPAPDDSFLSDDHTPVEFSLSFTPDADPTLRVLLEPGCGAGDLARNGRTGLRVVREMARRWGFGTKPLDDVEDLFFPAAPEGPLALWCALELLPGGIPKLKVYLNPAASGQERSAWTVREALRRLGHRQAFTSLPGGDRHLFLALDLGDWDEPRVKVYLAHQDLSAREAAELSRVDGARERREISTFFRMAAGDGTGAPGLTPQAAATGALPTEAGSASADFALDAGPAAFDLGAGPAALDAAALDPDAARGPRPARRPVQSCHAFTGTTSGRPSGFTLYIPVRDYAPHDGVALDRAVAVLRRYGMDPAPLVRAVSAVTSRRPEDGVGLIAYVGLVHQQGRAPRVTVYLSSEAYEVRPPAPATTSRTAAALGGAPAPG